MTNVQNSIEEVWLPVVGYEGAYEISSFGKIVAIARLRESKISPTGYVLIGKHSMSIGNGKGKGGYPGLILYGKGGKRWHSIHRLMAQHFIPNPDNKPHINHMNGVKTDYSLENLEWCTSAENNKHYFINNTEKALPHLIKLAMEGRKPVNQMDLSGNLIKVWPSAKEAADAGFNAKCISQACNHPKRLKTHKGFKWSHV